MTNKKFTVYLQPIYDIKTSEICGAEALARIQMPEGIINPIDFVPQMEADGTISALDLFMFESVCALIADWRGQGFKPSPIAVNMSKITLAASNISEVLEQTIRKFNLPQDSVEIEVTETLSCTDFAKLQATLKKIRQSGIKVALDDFGADYSQISALTKLNADVLKLDKSLLLDKSENEEKRDKIITHLCTLAKDIGMRVVAEGAETLRHIDFLRTTACDCVQGFYFARPMTVADFAKLLEQQI